MKLVPFVIGAVLCFIHGVLFSLAGMDPVFTILNIVILGPASILLYEGLSA